MDKIQNTNTRVYTYIEVDKIVCCCFKVIYSYRYLCSPEPIKDEKKLIDIDDEPFMTNYFER